MVCLDIQKPLEFYEGDRCSSPRCCINCLTAAVSPRHLHHKARASAVHLHKRCVKQLPPLTCYQAQSDLHCKGPKPSCRHSSEHSFTAKAATGFCLLPARPVWRTSRTLGCELYVQPRSFFLQISSFITCACTNFFGLGLQSFSSVALHARAHVHTSEVLDSPLSLSSALYHFSSALCLEPTHDQASSALVLTTLVFDCWSGRKHLVARILHDSLLSLIHTNL